MVILVTHRAVFTIYFRYMKSYLKTLLLIINSLAIANLAKAQTTLPFELEIEEITFEQMPAIQSYAKGYINGKYIFIGGRTDGLHKRRPFEAFDPAFNNTSIYLVDFNTKSVKTAVVPSTSKSLYDQLGASNIAFQQSGNYLLLAGGYGFSTEQNKFMTYPVLTVADLTCLKNAIENNTAITGCFRQIKDSRFQVTGAGMGMLNNEFIIAGGQNFEGQYNPQGPDHGPGFTQEYTNEIKRFTMNSDFSAVKTYSTIKDTVNLHRRDYNFSPQIFPDNTLGFTMFSGVFQYNANIPWHNGVDITSAGYTPRNDMDQLLNQYHSAKMMVWDSINKQYHTLFFGGIGRYYYDSSDRLINDENVPFVKTISAMIRDKNNKLTEYRLPQQMPSFLGAGAEFLPTNPHNMLHQEIVHLNNLQAEKTLIGYIAGGIESNDKNVFFLNTTESKASNKVFAVYLKKSVTTYVQKLNDHEVLSMKLWPVPAKDDLTVKVNSLFGGKIHFVLADAAGKIIYEDYLTSEKDAVYHIDTSQLNKGTYSLTLQSGGYCITSTFMK